MRDEQEVYSAHNFWVIGADKKHDIGDRLIDPTWIGHASDLIRRTQWRIVDLSDRDEFVRFSRLTGDNPQLPKPNIRYFYRIEAMD
jgi:hypothetical protein